MGTKQYDSATDLLTFSRASGGTALRKISYGNELVTNGTFDSDLSGWLASHGTSGQEFDNGTLQVKYPQYNTYSRQYLTGLVVGNTYQVNFSVTNDTQGSGGGSYVGIWETNSDGSYIERFTYTKGVVGSYTFTFTATSTASQIRLTKGSNTGVTNFDNISVKEVLFDQADGTLQVFNHGNNKPRIEYDATGAVKGLLIEEARTNLQVHSGDFSNSAWTKSASTVDTSYVAPDGTSTASKLTSTGAGGASGVYDNTGFIGTGKTLSCFMKAGSSGVYGWIEGIVGGTSPNATFDLENGTVVRSRECDASIESVGNGWFRCVVANTTFGMNFFSVGGSDNADSNSPWGASSLTQGKFIYAWGAQLEAGAFPSSYIPTTGATATRARDLAEIPTSAFGYNNDKGSIAVEFDSNRPIGQGYGAFVLSDGSPTNRILLYVSNQGQYRGFVVSSGAVQADVFAGSGGAPSELVKFAVGFSDNNFAVSLNGATAVTDTSVTIPSGLSKLALGYFYPTDPNTNLLNGHIKSIQYYPRQLTNTQLQELTT